MFIAARAALGAAGAGVIVMALASISVLFEEAERPKAIGVWSAANFLATPIGPILGGWLLSHYWWGWVFLVNLPVAVLGTGGAACWCRSSGRRTGRGSTGRASRSPRPAWSPSPTG